VKIRCAVCAEFEMCLECFSVGAQLRNHCKDHNFRVIDNMHFPFFEVTWSADEEMLLLEGLEVCGVFKTTQVGDLWYW
jgi:transcriptional adapter 2-alpha